MIRWRRTIPLFGVGRRFSNSKKNTACRSFPLNQGSYGHPRRKPTSCLVNLSPMLEFQGVRCEEKTGLKLEKELGDRFAQTACLVNMGARV